jgi:prevent-host-death family protein
MTQYSTTETRNNLSQLIDRARRGETVIITRHGHPVSELKSLTQVPSPVSLADLDWLVKHRVGTKPVAGNAGTWLEEMRDADED